MFRTVSKKQKNLLGKINWGEGIKLEADSATTVEALGIFYLIAMFLCSEVT